MALAGEEMTDPAALFSLAGHRALVTGASGTLGGGFARILHAAGARLVLAARRPSACAALATELDAATVAMDVTDPASVAAAFAEAEARLGAPCDVIVNNAGIAATAPALELRVEEWDMCWR